MGCTVMHEHAGAWRWSVALSLGLLGCGDDGGQRPLDPTTTGATTTGQVTTFEPTTTVDPTVTPTDGSSGSGPDGTGSGTGTTDDGDTTGSSGPGDTTRGETTEGEAPTVQSTTPADLESGVAAGTAIEVELSEVMDPSTITTNTADSGCTGSLQLSSDGFATCVRMAAAPSSVDDQTFVVTSMAPLQSTSTYQIRVLATVTNAGGTPMAADFTTGTGFTVRYFHTIAIDGVNDFTADETFASSTVGHTGYVAWDDGYLYLGMDSPDLAANSNQVWMVAYLGGPMGTTAGVTYNTQQPLLPFDARWHARWRASDDFGGALEWSGMAWVDPGFGPIAGGGDVATSGSFVELRIAWADLGDPDTIDLHLGMLREQPLQEASWAAVPEGSYVDGYDPDYAEHFAFDRAGSTVPADYAPL
jgi:hypothetical protein